ncbi:DUF2961 domain-containing protein [Nonomuraea angiospora]|uniref:DUF2961 domain-containing protein n=1 Tax=Nonomuraea angiospora TaxID=46172 RepID=UPI00344D3B29
MPCGLLASLPPLLFVGGALTREPAIAAAAPGSGPHGWDVYRRLDLRGPGEEDSIWFTREGAYPVASLMSGMDGFYPAWGTELAQASGVGYFTAVSRSGAATAGQDWTFVDVAGDGKLVGVAHTMLGGVPGSRGDLEGDERAYVDGARTPQLHGTGTEDFYESGWYFHTGMYAGPFTGNPAYENGVSACQYRCDAADRRPHGYAESGTAEQRSLTSAYEGDVTVTGETRACPGPITFQLAPDPGNAGVRLRCTSGRRATRRARVRGDGADVGEWLQPVGNQTARWLDDTHALPAALTSGKRAVTVALELQAGAPAWSAARYAADILVTLFTDVTPPRGPPRPLPEAAATSSISPGRAPG